DLLDLVLHGQDGGQAALLQAGGQAGEALRVVAGGALAGRQADQPQVVVVPGEEADKTLVVEQPRRAAELVHEGDGGDAVLVDAVADELDDVWLAAQQGAGNLAPRRLLDGVQCELFGLQRAGERAGENRFPLVGVHAGKVGGVGDDRQHVQRPVAAADAPRRQADLQVAGDGGARVHGEEMAALAPVEELQRQGGDGRRLDAHPHAQLQPLLPGDRFRGVEVDVDGRREEPVVKGLAELAQDGGVGRALLYLFDGEGDARRYVCGDVGRGVTL